jgi:hypothetical protein
MRSLPLSLTIAGAVLVSSLAAQAPMREGQWETTVQMQMAAMPVAMPPMTSSRCVTAEDIKDPSRSLPTGPDAKSSCKVSDYKTEGSKVTWKVACDSPQKMSGSGELLFAGDTYAGAAKLTMELGEITMKYSGKRLGDCKK